MNKHKNQKLITVDRYSWNPLSISPAVHQLATEAVLRDACAHHNVQIIKKDKDKFYKTDDGPVPRLFFCDANHDDYGPTLHDLRWAKEIGAKNICRHNYNMQGVSRAVNELGEQTELVGSVPML